MRSFKKIKLVAIALLFSAIAIWTGCREDQGAYSNPERPVVFSGNAYEYLQSKPGVYDSLLKVIDRLGYASILRDSNVTLFAVPNESFRTAFKNLNTQRNTTNKVPLDLASIDTAFPDSIVSVSHLDSMVAMYIIRGQFSGDKLNFQDPVSLKSVKFGLPMNARLRVSNSSGFNGGGSQYLEFNLVHRDPNGLPSLFKKDWALSQTGAINIQTKNAIIHELTPSHVFGFDEFVFRYSYVPPPPNLFKTLATEEFPYGGIHTVSDTLARSGSNPAHHNPAEFFELVYDGDIGSKFLYTDWANGKAGFWLKFQPRIPHVANAYTIISADDDPPRDPKNWRLEGSMNDTTWVVLDTKFNQVFSRRQMTRVFSFPNKVAYKYYRLYIVENSGHSTWMQIADYTINYSEE